MFVRLNVACSAQHRINYSAENWIEYYNANNDADLDCILAG